MMKRPLKEMGQSRINYLLLSFLSSCFEREENNVPEEYLNTVVLKSRQDLLCHFHVVVNFYVFSNKQIYFSTRKDVCLPTINHHI